MARFPEFLFLGDRLWLDFVNTEIVDRGEPHDLIPDFRRWMAWHAAADVAGTTEAKVLPRKWGSEADRKEALARAVAFRSELRRMAGRIASKKPVPESALRAINDVLRRGASYGQLKRSGKGFVCRGRRDLHDPLDLLVPVAEDAADLLCEGDPESLRKCGNPVCVLFFYDRSKSHTRRWCSMTQCGNRAKAAAHYRRKRRR